LTIQTAINNAVQGDTIVVCAGTYSEKLTSAAAGAYGAPIVLAAYGTQLVTITGSGSPVTWYARTATFGHDYWILHGLTFQDDLYDGSATLYYWVQITGSYVVIQWCRFPALGDIPTIYATRANRLLNIGGTHCTVRHSYFRGGSESIDITASTPRHYVLEYDTVHCSYWNNIVIPGDNAAEGDTHSGLIQYCVLDTAYGEDNIQLQCNYDIGEDYRVNTRILIRDNFMANAGENCVDLKSTDSTVCVENNIMVNSTGDDDGPVGGNDDWGGPAINVGSGSLSRWVIVRNNIIISNHTGIKMTQAYHIYNNVIAMNTKSYRGYQSADGYQGAYTFGSPGAGEVRVVFNNIFYGNSYGDAGNNELTLYGRTTSGNDFDYNVYWNDTDSVRFRTHDAVDEDTVLSGLTAWRAYLTNADFSGWLGKDSSSVWSDPLFASAPSAPAAYSASWDFTPQAGSPAIDNARSLTLASNSGSSSISLGVLDPYFFRDDYGIVGVVGDSIKVGSAAAVGLSGVNYAGKILTLTEARSWSAADGVWLWKNGAVVNDIGAIQVVE